MGEQGSATLDFISNTVSKFELRHATKKSRTFVASDFQISNSGIESIMFITVTEVQLRNLFTRNIDVFSRWCPILLFSIVLSHPAIGQLPNNEADKRKVGGNEQAENINKPVESQILMASKLLKTELKKAEMNLGRIEDLAFDLETEHLAVLVLETTETDKQPQWNWIPFVNGDRLIKFAWENKTLLAARPTSMNRMQANELYQSYKKAIYWMEFAIQHDTASGEKFDENDFQLTLLKSIVDKSVVDKFGTAVGHIEDVAISASKGTILYVVMRAIDDRLIAIPLGAFAADEMSSRWVVELAKDQILKFEAFDKSFPPTKADSGWLEFVAVKYGRGGLQTKKNKN